MSSCGYVRPEEADARTVRWTNSLRTVGQIIERIDAEASPARHRRPARQVSPDWDWVEPERAWWGGVMPRCARGRSIRWSAWSRCRQPEIPLCSRFSHSV